MYIALALKLVLLAATAAQQPTELHYTDLDGAEHCVVVDSQGQLTMECAQ